MFVSVKDFQHSWLMTIFYAISAQLISIGVSISIFYMIYTFSGHALLAKLIALCFYAVYCFKEYAKMQSSHSDGYFGLVKHYSKKQKQHKCLIYLTAFICAFGLELLFMIATLSFALKALPYHSALVSRLLIVGSCLLACIHMPVNYIFYENCVRKYFKVPKKIKKEMSGIKSRFVFISIIACIYCSSLLIMARCMVVSYAYFHPQGLVVSSLGMILGTIFGALSLYANYCIMHQTFCESSRYFLTRSQRSPFLNKLFSFKNASWEAQTRWMSSTSYAIYYSQPAIYMIFTSHMIHSMNSVVKGTLVLLCATIMIISYYFLTQNYLLRLFVVSDVSEA